MASAFGYRGYNPSASSGVSRTSGNSPEQTYNTFLLSDLNKGDINGQTFGGFWNKYGQQFAQPMMDAGQNIYNSAGTNANLAGGVFNSAGQLQSMLDPRSGVNYMNAAGGAFGGMNPYITNPNLPSSLDYSQYMGLGNSLLNQASNYDPMAAASDRFNTMESILNPYRQRDMKNMAQQGYMQGQLGSTGGAFSQMLSDYGAGVENQRQQNLLNAISSSEGTQGNLYNWGQGLAGLGIGAQGQGYNQAYQNAMVAPQLQQQGFQNAMGLAQSQADLGANMFNQGLGAWGQSFGTQLGALGAQQGAYGLQQIMPQLYGSLYDSSAGITQNRFNYLYSKGGGNGLGDALGSFAGGVLGGVAGPFGAAIGSNLGGSMFGNNSYSSPSTFQNTGMYIFPNG